MTTANDNALIANTPDDGSPQGNQRVRETLGGNENHYTATQDALVTAGVLVKRQGRGGSLRRAGDAVPPTVQDENTTTRQAVAPRQVKTTGGNTAPNESGPTGTSRSHADKAA